MENRIDLSGQSPDLDADTESRRYLDGRDRNGNRSLQDCVARLGGVIPLGPQSDRRSAKGLARGIGSGASSSPLNLDFLPVGSFRLRSPPPTAHPAPADTSSPLRNALADRRNPGGWVRSAQPSDGTYHRHRARSRGATVEASTHENPLLADRVIQRRQSGRLAQSTRAKRGGWAGNPQ